MEFRADKLASVASAIHSDLLGVKPLNPMIFDLSRLMNLAAPTAYFQVKPTEVSQATKWLIDYQSGKYRSLDSEHWTAFELPFWTVEECQTHVFEHLKGTAEALGENEVLQHLLFEGSVSSLNTFASQLKNYGDGHLSALAIEGIMKEVAVHTMQSLHARISHSTWAWRALQDSWHELMAMCCAFIYGKSYGRALRQARFRTAAKMALGLITFGLTAA